MARNETILRIPVKAARTGKTIQFDPETLERLEAFVQMHHTTHGAKPEFSDAVNALLEFALTRQPGLTNFVADQRKSRKS